MNQCSKSAYDEALSHYQEAVSRANVRLTTPDEVCDGIGGTDATLFGIAESAQAAVKACSEFIDIIGSSDEAKPLRDALKDSLALASFDGRLDVVDTQGNLVMNGLADVLDDGVTLWGPTPGAYGHISKIRFAANNKAVLSRLDIEVTPAAWNDVEVSFAVGSTNADGAEITITDTVGKQTVYRLAPGDVDPFDFRMVPEDPANDESFTAVASECDA